MFPASSSHRPSSVRRVVSHRLKRCEGIFLAAALLHLSLHLIHVSLLIEVMQCVKDTVHKLYCLSQGISVFY